jgi:hypothetical protein
MNKILIGFGSKAQIGKDFAVISLKKAGYDVERVAFADELKKDVATLFSRNGLDFDELMKDPAKKELIRPLLVSYGQIMREFDPDIWVNKALKDKERKHQITAVTDVRFPNEVIALKKMGGIYIDIQAKVEPVNEVERQNSALLYHMADVKITNDFTPLFPSLVTDLVELLLTDS